MTAIGPIHATRWPGRCRSCDSVGFAADGVIGRAGWLTLRARRTACRAGLHDPFRKAEGLLRESSGWSVDAETPRRPTHAEAAEAARGRSARTGLPEEFARASGDAESHIDAGKANTPDGGKDVKVAPFAVRDRGSPATGAECEPRGWPAPSVRSVVAAGEAVGLFERRCRAEADRSKPTDPTRPSVPGDGAEWIWNAAARPLPGAAQVLDVYHAAQHVATAGRAAFGAGPDFATWLEGARRLLGGDGYCEASGRPPPDPMAAGRSMAAAGARLNYFAGHRDRLGYAARSQRGQAIGSGLVAGAIEELVNLRLKRTGARWRAEREGTFVELLALCNTVERDEHWKALAA